MGRARSQDSLIGVMLEENPTGKKLFGRPRDEERRESFDDHIEFIKLSNEIISK